MNDQRMFCLGRSQGVERIFRVLLVYEDYICGKSAMDIYQRVFLNFGRDLDFRISIWRLDALRESLPALVRDAVEADAIIIATHRWDELPVAIRRWTEDWIPKKRGRPAVLIALFDPAPDREQARGAYDYLKKAAAGAGIDFMVQDIRPMRNRAALFATDSYTNNRLAPEGWGLND
jgi:hypothetical protein